MAKLRLATDLDRAVATRHSRLHALSRGSVQVRKATKVAGVCHALCSAHDLHESCARGRPMAGWKPCNDCCGGWGGSTHRWYEGHCDRWVTEVLEDHKRLEPLLPSEPNWKVPRSGVQFTSWLAACDFKTDTLRPPHEPRALLHKQRGEGGPSADEAADTDLGQVPLVAGAQDFVALDYVLSVARTHTVTIESRRSLQGGRTVHRYPAAVPPASPAPPSNSAARWGPQAVTTER